MEEEEAKRRKMRWRREGRRGREEVKDEMAKTVEKK